MKHEAVGDAGGMDSDFSIEKVISMHNFNRNVTPEEAANRARA